MTIVRLFTVIFIFLLCPIQGMDLSIKVIPQPEKISSDMYRQRIRERQQAQEELWKDAQEALGAEEDIVALVNRQINENLNLLKDKLPVIFIKEFQEIRNILCHTEQLFEYKIEDKIFYDKTFFEINDLLKQKGLKSVIQAIDKINEFTQKWDAITDSIDSIRLANNHIIWYQNTWNQLIGKIKRREIDGKELYERVKLFHKWLNDLADALKKIPKKQTSSVRSKSPLLEDHGLEFIEEATENAISFFKITGTILWEIVKLNVSNLPDYKDLPKNFFFPGNTVQAFLTPPEKGITLYKDITSQIYESIRFQNSNDLSLYTKPSKDHLYCIASAQEEIKIKREDFEDGKVFDRLKQAVESNILPGFDDKEALFQVISKKQYLYGCDLYFISEEKGVDADHTPALKKLEDGRYRLFVCLENGSVSGPIAPESLGIDVKDLIQLWNNKGNRQSKFLRRGNGVIKSIVLQGGHTNHVPKKMLPPEIKIPNGDFLGRLTEAFTHPNQWRQQPFEVNRKLKSIFQLRYVMKPLKHLAQHYDHFKKTYLGNLRDSEDILAPWAYGHFDTGQKFRLRQSLARKAVFIDSNGPLSFGISEESRNGSANRMGKAIDEVRLAQRTGFPLRFGEWVAESTLEKLFGLSGNSLYFAVFSNISYKARSPRNSGGSNSEEDYLLNLSSWGSKKGVNFSVIQQQFQGDNLKTFIENSLDKGNLDQLDPHMHILFALLTQSCASSVSFGVVNNNGRFTLKKIAQEGSSLSQDSFLHPSFQLTMDNKHQLVEKQDIYFLPQMFEEIPEKVKNEFMSHNFWLVLSYWLKELSEKQKDLDDLREAYDNLKEIDEPMSIHVAGYNLFLATDLVKDLSNKEFTEGNIYFDLEQGTHKIKYKIEDKPDEKTLNILAESPLTRTALEKKKFQILEEIAKNGDIDLKKVNQAQSWGLEILGRPETIEQLIHNFSMIESLLKKPDITYWKIFEHMRQEVFQCYESVMGRANQKIERKKVVIFFEQLVSFIIPNLRNMWSDMEQSGNDAPYSLKQLEIFVQEAQKCLKKAKAEMNILEDARGVLNCLTGVLERTQEELQEASIATEEKASIDLTNNKDTQISTGCHLYFIPHKGGVDIHHTPALKKLENGQYELFVRQENGSVSGPLDPEKLGICIKDLKKLWKNKGDSQSRFLQPDNIIMENIIQGGHIRSRKIELEQKITETTEKIKVESKKIESAIENLLFEKIIEGINEESGKFFQKTYNCDKMKKIFQANTTSKALDILNDKENSIIYEDIIAEKSTTSGWEKIPVFEKRKHLEMAKISGSTRTVAFMVQDLMKEANISEISLDKAIEILSILLELKPEPTEYHKSWDGLFQRAREEFLAFPWSVQRFFYKWTSSSDHHMDGKPNKQSVLEMAQLKESEQYARIIVAVSKTKDGVSSEKIAGYLYRQLWLGGEQLSPQDQLFFEALLDLLLLPSYSSSEVFGGISSNPGTLGAATHAISQTGPIELRLAVGDHYVLSRSEKWALLFDSCQTLSLEARKIMMSHHLTLLHLGWLDGLKALGSSLSFHPWFVKTLVKKSTQIQKMLFDHLHLTIRDFMEALWPEMFCEYQHKFQAYEKDNKKKNKLKAYKADQDVASEVIKNLRNQTDQLSSMEGGGYDFSCIPKGCDKNLFTILQDWDDHREAYAASPSLSLSDAATEIFNYFIPPDDPSGFGYLVLNRALELASRFPIQVAKMTHDHWKNPDILKGLVVQEASDEILQLVMALQLGCPVGNIRLEGNFLKISGIKKGDAKRLRELIGFISGSLLSDKIKILDLSSNHIFSYVDNTLSIHRGSPLIDHLKNFKNLKELILSDNPISNPIELEVLLPSLNTDSNHKLQKIILEETYTPTFHKFNVKMLKERGKESIVCNNKTPIKPGHFDLSNEERRAIFDDLCAELKRCWSQYRLSDKSVSRKGKGIYISDHDVVASIMEQLGENFWHESLGVWRNILEGIFNNRDKLTDHELLDALNECNQTKENKNERGSILMAGSQIDIDARDSTGLKKSKQKVTNDGQLRVPVKEAAFKLAFALKYKELPIGISPENLGFMRGIKTKEPIITINPYCLVNLKISDDLSPISLEFLSTFSGAYRVRLLGENPDKILNTLKFYELGIYSDGDYIYCKNQDKEGFNMIQNEDFKKIIQNTGDKKIVSRLKKAVKTDTPVSSEDKGRLILYASRMGYILPGLVKLDLSYAKLTSIFTMPVMENLVTLNLSHNEITSLGSFCQPVENVREVYKFPRLKNLDLSHNSISLTEESDEKRFNKYFAALRYLDISYNQLESVPMMNTKWFEPNQKNPQYLSICCNNIPIKNLHKLYNWEFGGADSREEWNRKLPPSNSIKIYRQDQSGQIYCQMYGQKEDMFLPSNKFAEFEWGNSKGTIPDKGYFILSIAGLNQDYLNTNFLRVMPQREKK